MKQWALLILLAVSSLRAMDTKTQSWLSEIIKLKGYLNPNDTSQYNGIVRTQINFTACNALSQILGSSYPDQQEISRILSAVPEVLGQKPHAIASNWVVLALYYASRAMNIAQADMLDDIAIFLFNYMKQSALKSNNYAQELVRLLQDENPITYACRYKRGKVLQVLLIDVNVTWRGQKDSESPLEWAQKQFEGNLSCQKTEATIKSWYAQRNSAQPKNLPSNIYAEHIPYAQIIVQKSQEIQQQAGQQYYQYQSYYQYYPQQNTQGGQQQNHSIPYVQTHGGHGSQSHRIQEQVSSGGNFWKRMVLFGLAACVCKLFYDWYYQQPDIEPDAQDDSDYWQSQNISVSSDDLYQ